MPINDHDNKNAEWVRHRFIVFFSFFLLVGFDPPFSIEIREEFKETEHHPMVDEIEPTLG